MLTEQEKKEVEKLVIEHCNHNYVRVPDSKGKDYRRDGKWSSEQVYEAFKNDPFWYVKHTDNIVYFRERKEKEITKRDRQFTMMLFVHYITKHRWVFNKHRQANIVVYGGFARSAALAYISCMNTMYESILCFKRYKVPKDLAKYILTPLIKTWCDDFTWFKDGIHDIDLLVTYRDGYKPSMIEFNQDVIYIINVLNELCLRTPNCEYSFKSVIDSENVRDENPRRKGVTSHKEGNYFNYLAEFTANEYIGEKITECRKEIPLDITTMIDNDISDVNVNNLVLYYDRKIKNFRINQRKRINFREGPLTLKKIFNHIQRHMFRHVPLDYRRFDTLQEFLKAYRILQIRVSNLEYRGWKQDPRYKTLDTNSYEPNNIKKIKKYYNRSEID